MKTIKYKIKEALLLFNPDRYFRELFNNIEKIEKNYPIIKNIPFSNLVLSEFLNWTTSYLKNKKKFNRLRLLKLIKYQVRKCENYSQISHSNRDKLFFLFTQFITKTTYAAVVNSFLIGIPLRDDQIKWLIDNNERSNHILNRLLRYPAFNKLISDWALQEYGRRKNSRRSELLGLFLTNPPQDIVDLTETQQLYWGIYYSKLPDLDKMELLNKYFNEKYIDDWLVIVFRLGFKQLLENKL